MFRILQAALLTGLAALTSLELQAQTLKDLQGGLGALGLGSKSSTSVAPANVEAGLIEALVVGSERVIGKLGAVNGFNDDPLVHIPLPQGFREAQSALRMAGLSGMADDLELRMNRAAEQATPIARDVILDAIHGLSFDDAMGIFNGPDDAATQYLKKTAGPGIATGMRPIVDNALAETGAVQAFDMLMGDYEALPFVPDIEANLSDHVLDYAQKGIFGYLAKEEAAIRENPAARTTELLKDVFGG
jgi:hypothetical protein